jgi:hypothetical protein
MKGRMGAAAPISDIGKVIIMFEIVEIDGERYLALSAVGYNKAQDFLDLDPIEALAQAFELSIAKWEFIRDNEVNSDGGGQTCGLCMISSIHCGNCPIAAYVGNTGCHETPYYDAVNADTIQPDKARAEIDFLWEVFAAWEDGDLNNLLPVSLMR